jgi:2-phosphosulfolactate phosphatase
LPGNPLFYRALGDVRETEMTFDQSQFDIRCEWGDNGVSRLAPISDAVIIVDIMSFTTCVEVAASRGAVVFPYRYRDDSAADYARSIDAELAGPRGKSRYSLSPASLIDIPEGTRLVLPSPNGSTLTLSTGDTPTLAGCLRNCKAVALAAMRCGRRICVIPAGERWRDDDSLRPAYEDLIGAGAIIHYLGGTRSPESEAAVAAFQYSRDSLAVLLRSCSSGRELVELGFEHDIPIIEQVDVSNCVPMLRNGAYVRSTGPSCGR